MIKCASRFKECIQRSFCISYELAESAQRRILLRIFAGAGINSELNSPVRRISGIWHLKRRSRAPINLGDRELRLWLTTRYKWPNYAHCLWPSRRCQREFVSRPRENTLIYNWLDAGPVSTSTGQQWDVKQFFSVTAFISFAPLPWRLLIPDHPKSVLHQIFFWFYI